MKIKITDRDNGYAHLMLTMRKLDRGASVKVGVVEEPHTGTKNLSIANLGKIHEFGLGVPQRSFLRAWVDRHENEIHEKLLNPMEGALFGDLNVIDVLRALGRWAVEGVKDRIRSNIPPPLAEKTVKRKGHALALFETGQLIDGIVYEVEQ